jgi:hypothetical protein
MLKTIGSCNSIFSIKTRLWAGQNKFHFPEGARDFSIPHNSQNKPGSHRASYSMHSRVHSLSIKWQIWHSEDRGSWYILIIKPTRCTNFSNYFWNRTLHVSDRFSVHHQESSTVYTATGICYRDSADCLLAGSGWNIKWPGHKVDHWSPPSAWTDLYLHLLCKS